MNDLGEATLLLNWLKESDAMESNDYGFLLNLFLEINHMISECPNTPEGRHLAHQLQKKSNTIGHKIESLEDTIDVYLTEYFDATTSEISDYDGADDSHTDPDYEAIATYTRKGEGKYSWTVVDVVGPAGSISSDWEFSVDDDDIKEFVDEWAEEHLEDIYDNPDSWLSDWDDTDPATYNEEITMPIETIEYQFTETIGEAEFTIKVLIAVEIIFSAASTEFTIKDWERK
tara:strand:+ start:2342 stop:3031 length:690 start_codon:yes stop_codon:yes gene_type:complete